MTPEGYEQKYGGDSSESWNEAKPLMNNEEYNASWQRGIEYRNMSPEEQELLKSSHLVVEFGENENLPNGEHRENITIKGTIEGKEVVLHCKTGGVKYSNTQFSNYDKSGIRIPDSIGSLSSGAEDEFSGEVDGQTISAEEAKELWYRYQRVADVTDTDERLAKYVQKSKE